MTASPPDVGKWALESELFDDTTCLVISGFSRQQTVLKLTE